MVCYFLQENLKFDKSILKVVLNFNINSEASCPIKSKSLKRTVLSSIFMPNNSLKKIFSLSSDSKFSILFLFIFIPLLANAENTDISKKNEESFKLFEDGFKNIINKLPPTSKIAVPEFKIQVPEFETSDKEDEKRQAAIITAEKSRIEKIRIRTERIFEKNNVRIVERESFKDVENEILLSQTGEIDPKTSAQFGKAIGATYIVLGGCTNNIVY